MVGDDDRDDDDERRCRDDSARSPPVEASKGGAACALALAQEQPRDDEARDDEEDLDADVAAAEPGYAGVVHESQQDGDGTHPLHVGSEFAVTGWCARLIACRRQMICRDRHHAGGYSPPRALALPTVHPLATTTSPYYRSSELSLSPGGDSISVLCVADGAFGCAFAPPPHLVGTENSFRLSSRLSELSQLTEAVGSRYALRTKAAQPEVRKDVRSDRCNIGMGLVAWSRSDKGPDGLFVRGRHGAAWSRSVPAACCRPAWCSGTRGALRADRTTGAVRQPLRRERR